MDKEMVHSNGNHFMTTFLIGAAVGGAAALLLAPCSGNEMRRKLRNGLGSLKQKGEELLEEAGENVAEQAEKFRSRSKSASQAI